MDNGQSELDSADFEKTKTLVFKVAILCVCVGRVVVCGGGFVGVLMRIVNDCMVVIGRGDGRVGGGCV